MKVEYRSVNGFPGYRVGPDGSVWSCWQRAGLRPRKGTRFAIGDSWRLLKPYPDRSGYLRVSLARDGRMYGRLVHRLVLEAFIGPCPKDHEVRHFPDRDPGNNNLSNLSWGTRKENQADRLVHGTHSRGERSGMAKLSEDTVLAIRSEYVKGVQSKGATAIAKRRGIPTSTVQSIIQRKSWRHL